MLTGPFLHLRAESGATAVSLPRRKAGRLPPAREWVRGGLRGRRRRSRRWRFL